MAQAIDDKSNSQPVKIAGEDELHCADVKEDDKGDKRLFTDAHLDSGELVPTITNKFRIRSNVGDININTSYTVLFTRSGEGLFFGFQTGFNNSDIIIKLTLDTAIVFELSLDDIRQFQFNDTTTTRTQMGGFLTTIGNVLDFSSKFAIPYETGFTIEAKTGSGTHKNNNWIVFLTEDA